MGVPNSGMSYAGQFNPGAQLVGSPGSSQKGMGQAGAPPTPSGMGFSSWPGALQSMVGGGSSSSAPSYASMLMSQQPTQQPSSGSWQPPSQGSWDINSMGQASPIGGFQNSSSATPGAPSTSPASGAPTMPGGGAPNTPMASQVGQWMSQFTGQLPAATGNAPRDQVQAFRSALTNPGTAKQVAAAFQALPPAQQVQLMGNDDANGGILKGALVAGGIPSEQMAAFINNNDYAHPGLSGNTGAAYTGIGGFTAAASPGDTAGAASSNGGVVGAGSAGKQQFNPATGYMQTIYPKGDPRNPPGVAGY